MNQLKNKIGTRLPRVALSSGLLRGGLAILAMAGLLGTAATARAACGMAGMGTGTRIQLPMLAQGGGEGASSAQGSGRSIVGLWGVVYTAGGSVFNETFDQWHSDGTEFESAYLPVAQGNICVGVWKLIAPGTVRLHHIGWTFDPKNGGTANGTFTLDETITVSSDGQSYTGTFTFKAFNLTGGLGTELSGTILAQRITVD